MAISRWCGSPSRHGFRGGPLLAYASGLIMLLGGAGLLFRATVAWSVRILFPYLIVWLLLKVPALVVAPQMEAGLARLWRACRAAAGGWVLFATLAELPAGSPLKFATGENEHPLRADSLCRFSSADRTLTLVYVKETVELVPAWLPYRVGWAYLTGAGQIACGLGVLFSILPRVAATAEAGMISLFTLLVWAPAILAAPRTRLPWTAFFISWAIASAAWVVAQNIAAKALEKGTECQALVVGRWSKPQKCSRFLRRFFRPSGAAYFPRLISGLTPGCNLSPLRGYARFLQIAKPIVPTSNDQRLAPATRAHYTGGARRRTGRFQLRRVLLRVLQEQRDLVVDLFQR